MGFNFDEEIDRIGTQCTKWEFIMKGDQLVYRNQTHPNQAGDRLLPLWVADMDFRCPPAVVEAITDRARHGVYGYSYPCDSYYEAVIGWMDRRHGWTIDRDWIVHTPGVVPALHMLVQTFVEPGEKVIVQRPVYYPFFDAIESNQAQIVSNSLVYSDGDYAMDFEDLARKAADPAVKMAILCSPHNPVGRVWTREELIRFGEICLENDVLVVSDEVHNDLIYRDQTFTTFAKISADFARRSIVCTAASKSFNLAGLRFSNIVISNPALRERFASTVRRSGLYGAGPFGIVAVEAAYNFGEAWLDAAMDYIEANCQFMIDFLAEHLPQLRVIRPQGTYLVWVDWRALGLAPAKRKSLLMEQARVYLDEGELFGPEGEGFERFNIACPRSILEEALNRIKDAVVSSPILG
jgi:cystathionine beta-lyase